MLRFDGGEIIAGRDDAAVQDDQIVFARGKDDRLFRAAAKGDTGEEDGGVIKKFTEGTIIHLSGGRPTYWIYEFYNTNPFPVKFYFSPLQQNRTPQNHARKRLVSPMLADRLFHWWSVAQIE